MAYPSVDGYGTIVGSFVHALDRCSQRTHADEPIQAPWLTPLVRMLHLKVKDVFRAELFHIANAFGVPRSKSPLLEVLNIIHEVEVRAEFFDIDH